MLKSTNPDPHGQDNVGIRGVRVDKIGRGVLSENNDSYCHLYISSRFIYVGGAFVHDCCGLDIIVSPQLFLFSLVISESPSPCIRAHSILGKSKNQWVVLMINVNVTDDIDDLTRSWHHGIL